MHTYLENEIMYPRVRELLPALEEDILESYEEHHVADVLVVGPQRVWVDRGGGLEPTGITFDDDAAVRRLASRLALGAGRRLDDAQPWVDAQLTSLGRRGLTVRLHAVIPPLAADGTCISLRVLRSASKDLPSLVESGAIPSPAASSLPVNFARKSS